MKEREKFLPSNLFEGMTSIRAILQAGELGISDRRITEILYDKNRRASRALSGENIRFKRLCAYSL